MGSSKEPQRRTRATSDVSMIPSMNQSESRQRRRSSANTQIAIELADMVVAEDVAVFRELLRRDKLISPPTAPINASTECRADLESTHNVNRSSSQQLAARRQGVKPVAILDDKIEKMAKFEAFRLRNSTRRILDWANHTAETIVEQDEHDDTPISIPGRGHDLIDDTERELFSEASLNKEIPVLLLKALDQHKAILSDSMKVYDLSMDFIRLSQSLREQVAYVKIQQEHCASYLELCAQLRFEWRFRTQELEQMGASERMMDAVGDVSAIIASCSLIDRQFNESKEEYEATVGQLELQGLTSQDGVVFPHLHDDKDETQDSNNGNGREKQNTIRYRRYQSLLKTIDSNTKRLADSGLFIKNQTPRNKAILQVMPAFRVIGGRYSTWKQELQLHSMELRRDLNKISYLRSILYRSKPVKRRASYPMLKRELQARSLIQTDEMSPADGNLISTPLAVVTRNDSSDFAIGRLQTAPIGVSFNFGEFSITPITTNAPDELQSDSTAVERQIAPHNNTALQQTLTFENCIQLDDKQLEIESSLVLDTLIVMKQGALWGLDALRKLLQDD